MKYIDFVKEEGKKIGLDVLKDKIIGFRGKRVLIYSHDDPDGIASALIFTEILKALNIEYELLIPETMELEEERLRSDLKKGNFEAVFVLDKATMGYYDDYHKIIENFFVIDHHPLIGKKIENIIVINPQLYGEYKTCSCSHLVHMLYTLFNFKDILIDFYNLTGLKGDWAIEPATDYYSPYVKSFIDEVKSDFLRFFEKIEDEPTLFEVKQREKTTLLNQITEIIFAVSGGGFQYFYNERDTVLKDIYQPVFIFEKLRDISSEDILKIKNRDDFIKVLGDSRVDVIWKFFKSDWKMVEGYFDNCIYIKTIKDTDLYMFSGNRIPLMPFVGSVKLHELPFVKGKEKLIVMANNMFEDGVHFSFRATNSNIHCGDLAHKLVKKLLEEYNYPQYITGGGHPFAAEARTRRAGVPVETIFKKFFEILEEM